MLEPPGQDNRIYNDRRRQPTRPFTLPSLFGRRKSIRRHEDKEAHKYVDRYSLRSVAIVLFILVLSVADAIFTLTLVSRGAEEINPIMDFFLQRGPAIFLGVKYFLTVGSLLCFLILKNHYFLAGRISVKTILATMLILYVVLIGYELSLLAMT
jgi:hypothetical protein